MVALGVLENGGNGPEIGPWFDEKIMLVTRVFQERLQNLPQSLDREGRILD